LLHFFFDLVFELDYLEHLYLLGFQLVFPDLELLNLEFVLQLGDVQTGILDLLHLIDDGGALSDDFIVLVFDDVPLDQDDAFFGHLLLLFVR
jgi:hypothetical protein